MIIAGTAVCYTDTFLFLTQSDCALRACLTKPKSSQEIQGEVFRTSVKMIKSETRRFARDSNSFHSSSPGSAPPRLLCRTTPPCGGVTPLPLVSLPTTLPHSTRLPPARHRCATCVSLLQDQGTTNTALDRCICSAVLCTPAVKVRQCCWLIASCYQAAWQHTLYSRNGVAETTVRCATGTYIVTGRQVFKAFACQDCYWRNCPQTRLPCEGSIGTAQV